jgi:hypothetical protein
MPGWVQVVNRFWREHPVWPDSWAALGFDSRNNTLMFCTRSG